MKKTVAAKKSSHVIVCVGVLLISIIAIGNLALSLLPKLVGGQIAKRLSQTLNLPVKIGKSDFSLGRPDFSIQNLEIANPSGFPSAVLAQLETVKATYSRKSILLGRFDVKSVKIHFREFRLMRGKAGTLNLAKPRSVAANPDTIDEVAVNLGPVTFTDLSGEQPVQNTFDLGLKDEVYRKVKGISGIAEIIRWEVLKRTGAEEEKKPGIPILQPPPVPEKY